MDFVVPHQAGTGVVRLTAMKLEELGIRGEVINGLTRDVGNISSSSVPYALQQNWDRLHGTIICPTAAVGRPGRAQLSQGCIVLKATRTRAISGALRMNVATTAQSGLPGSSAPHTVGIIGAGLMGTAIAATAVRHGLNVVICDADHKS